MNRISSGTLNRQDTRESLNAANEASSRVSTTAGTVMFSEFRKNSGSWASSQALM